MKIKSIIKVFVVFLVSLLNSDSDFKKYDKLKINDVASIKIEDLPEEFGKEAFKTIDEFIKKTAYLNHEWLLYFDYKTGEILRCIEGKRMGLNLNLEMKSLKVIMWLRFTIIHLTLCLRHQVRILVYYFANLKIMN